MTQTQPRPRFPTQNQTPEMGRQTDLVKSALTRQRSNPENPWLPLLWRTSAFSGYSQLHTQAILCIESSRFKLASKSNAIHWLASKGETEFLKQFEEGG